MYITPFVYNCFPNWHIYNTTPLHKGQTEEGSMKMIKAREREVLCETVSGKNDLEASPTNPQQYGCINKVWTMTPPINIQARGKILPGSTHRYKTTDNYNREGEIVFSHV